MPLRGVPRGLLEYSRMRRALEAVKAGRALELRVPATTARRRLTMLRNAGLSIRAIAELSGVSVGPLQHLQQRDRRHVAIITEQRLEACRP
jgi:hypothetical protein